MRSGRVDAGAPMRTGRLVAPRWWRWLRVSDPGGLRLRSAATTTAAVLLAATALFPLLRAAGEPLSTGLLGVMVAMHSAAAVKDSRHRQRVWTTIWAAPVTMAAVTVAAALGGTGGWGRVGFVALLIPAVWARRFGPRGSALGVVAVIAYFFTLFLGPDFDEVPLLLAIVAIGVAATLLVRTVLLPDRPRWEIGRLARALRAACAAALEQADPAVPRRPAALQRRLARLAITGVRIGDWLDRNRAEALVTVNTATFAQRTFDAQVASEELASALWNLPAGEPVGEQLSAVLGAVVVALADGADADQLRAARAQAAAAMQASDPATAAGVATRLCLRVVQDHSAIHAIGRRPGGPARAPRTAGSADPAITPVTPIGAGEKTTAARRWDPSTRLAVQVAVAATAAMLLGGVISADHWYWAVLTAFLVFNGAANRGEILARAGHRIAGSIIGVPIGVAAALAVGDRPGAQIAVMVVCVFFAFYLSTVAYLLQTLFITVLVVVLYAMLDGFTAEVLAIRIAETAVGAIVGITAAFAIASTRTRTDFDARTGEHLATMTVLIDQAVAAVTAPGRPTPVFATTRELDTVLQQVLEAAKPLQISPASRTRRRTARRRRWLQNAHRSTHALARAGATAARAEPDTAPAAATADRLRDAAAGVSADIERTGRVLRGGKAGPSADPAVLSAMVTDVQSPGVLRLAVRSLNRIDRAMTTLAGRPR